jgi:hypothetical protein
MPHCQATPSGISDAARRKKYAHIQNPLFCPYKKSRP